MKRIHITHTDMDGVGCAVIHKCATALVTDQAGNSPLTVIYEPKPSRVNTTIMETAKTVLAQGFNKESDMLAFLVTDLANVDPDVFTKIRETLGMPCYYVVIDHHVSKYNNGSAMLYVHTKNKEISRSHGWYFTNQTICASYIMYNIVHDIYKAYTMSSTTTTSDNYRQSIFLENSLARFSEAINRYDTGAWGKWAVTDPKEMAEEIMLNMVFQSYDEDYDQSVDDIYQLLSYPDSPASLGLVDQYAQVVYKQHKELLREYAYFMANMKSAIGNDGIIHIGSIDMYYPLNIKYYEYATEEDEIKYFSLISREILENDPNINILVLVDRVHDTVGLRSASERFDVAYIANLNGGGGHKRAAGFPIAEKQ